MLTDHGYQYSIYKTLHNIYYIKDLNPHSTKITENNLVFSKYDQGLVKISLRGKVGNYDIIKDGRYNLLGIDTYLQGKLSDIICVTTTRNSQYPRPNIRGGGGRYFSDH